MALSLRVDLTTLSQMKTTSTSTKPRPLRGALSGLRLWKRASQMSNHATTMMEMNMAATFLVMEMSNVGLTS